MNPAWILLALFSLLLSSLSQAQQPQPPNFVPRRCSAHFEAASGTHIVLERFPSVVGEEEFWLESPLVMVDFKPMVLEGEELDMQRRREGMVVSTGVIRGNTYSQSLDLRYDYVKKTIHLDIWSKMKEERYWMVSNVSFAVPPSMPMDGWFHVLFSKEFLQIQGTVLPITLDFQRTRLSPTWFFSIGSGFTGNIDEVSVWEREAVRSPPCVYGMGYATNPVVYLSFDDCNGLIIADEGIARTCGRLHNIRQWCEFVQPNEAKPFWLSNSAYLDRFGLNSSFNCYPLERDKLYLNYSEPSPISQPCESVHHGDVATQCPYDAEELESSSDYVPPSDGNSFFNEVLTLVLTCVLFFCVCMCLRWKEKSVADSQPIPQEADTIPLQPRSASPGPFDFNSYEYNSAYPGSYIPDVVQMRVADVQGTMMAPIVVYPGEEQQLPYVVPGEMEVYPAPYLPMMYPSFDPSHLYAFYNEDSHAHYEGEERPVNIEE